MKKIPMRTCVICREKCKKSELIRIVNNEEEGVVADASGKMNGRGAYVCANMQCITQPKAQRALAAALKTEVTREAYTAIVNKIEKLVNRNAGIQSVKLPAVAAPITTE